MGGKNCVGGESCVGEESCGGGESCGSGGGDIAEGAFCGVTLSGVVDVVGCGALYLVVVVDVDVDVVGVVDDVVVAVVVVVGAYFVDDDDAYFVVVVVVGNFLFVVDAIALVVVADFVVKEVANVVAVNYSAGWVSGRVGWEKAVPKGFCCRHWKRKQTLHHQAPLDCCAFYDLRRSSQSPSSS